MLATRTPGKAGAGPNIGVGNDDFVGGENDRTFDQFDVRARRQE